MFSNLPVEFQEIARRLARQDRELKKSQSDLRGRSNSRKSSRMNSRTSSLSPTRGSRARTHSQTARDGNMEIFMFDGDKVSTLIFRIPLLLSIILKDYFKSAIIYSSKVRLAKETRKSIRIMVNILFW